MNCVDCMNLKTLDKVIFCSRKHLLSKTGEQKLFSYNSYRINGINKSWVQDSCVDYDPEVFEEI